MKEIKINGHEIPIVSMNTAIVGAGAAGLSAADRLHAYDQEDIAIICENMLFSTSRESGSDKQTYYKLTLSGGQPDSVRKMADTLYKGQCVDGDIALAEAALSAQCFYRLADLGVPFPVNRYGETIGYKTDYDPLQRATSAGPLTSKMMTECLTRSVRQRGIKIYEGYQVISVIAENNRVFGLLCLKIKQVDVKAEYLLFNCKNVVFATGGPAGMYADSVYPASQYGSTGIAFEAGVKGKNLTEWQYGIASLRPRWNVSGTYMQALPRFFSTDAEGNDEKEFLKSYFRNGGEYLNKVFLKGYEWPFDVSKIANGSSIIDLLIYVESYLKGRRVYLDYRKNPLEDMDFSLLGKEAAEYLNNVRALYGTPVERLMHMNEPAYALYLNKGVDLKKEPLEIALCAQHNNGGLCVDHWWQTNIEGFFAVGEASATHGVYRPGGSALNAGQVGATRAAKYIAKLSKGVPVGMKAFERIARKYVSRILQIADNAMGDEENISEIWCSITRHMSRVGAAVRSKGELEAAKREVEALLAHFEKRVKISSMHSVSKLYRLRDTLISQFVYISAMIDYIDHGGKSRGSALYLDKKGQKSHDVLDGLISCSLDDGSTGNVLQEVLLYDGKCEFFWRQVRNIPEDDEIFENVWRTYRENGNIY